ncbi:MAG: mechanosensitive ion channel family protein [Candidatus Eremiobacteraeota bacterium]|nr:mechanosensitive ion channel family protein [Candidatus Eremiobacteraeota bacterium]
MNKHIIFALLFAVLALLLMMKGAPAQEQSPAASPGSVPEPSLSPMASPAASASASPAVTSSALPAASPSLPLAESAGPAPGKFSLFSLLENIFTPTIPFIPAASSKISSFERRRLINRRLDMVKTLMNSEEVILSVDNVGGITVIRAGDIIVMTVIDEDLPEYNLSHISAKERRELEQEFAEKALKGFNASLKRYRKMSEPGYLHAAAAIAAVLIAIATIINFLLRRFFPRTYLRWFVRFGIWIFTAIIVLLLFPFTRGAAFLAVDIVIMPILILWGVIAGACLIDPLLQFIAAKDIEGLRSLGRFRGAREKQRVETLLEAARYVIRSLVILMAIIIYLKILKVNTTAIAAFAGAIGVILSFVGQDFLRDTISGFIIVLEDQFGVGDIIESNRYGGIVESFSLRSTRLRDIKGALCTVPNSLLREVRNLSHNFAQVDFKVQVSYRADIDLALRVLKEEADLLRESASGDIIEEPELAGVDRLGESSVELRMFLRTRPKMQWYIERELNRRIKQRFDREGIEIPFNQLDLWIRQGAPLPCSEGQREQTHVVSAQKLK